MDPKSRKNDVELPLLSKPSQDLSFKPGQNPSVDIEKPVSKLKYFDFNAFNLLLFSWVTKIVNAGNVKVFQQDQHYNLRNTEDSAWISDKFSKEWEGAKNESLPLLKAQYRTFKTLVLTSQILGLIQTCLDFTGPVLVSKIIAYVAATDSSLSEGMTLILAFVVTRLGVILVSSQNMLIVTMIQNKVIAGTRSLIYRKFLKFPLMRDQDYSAGTIMNHMLVDVENTAKIFFHLPNLVQFPFIVILGITMMYTAVGLAFVGGVFSVIAISFVVSWVSKILFRFQKAVMEAKDNRMKKSTEVLTGIKYIKMCGLETKFIDSVFTSRENELFWLKKRQTMIACRIFSVYLIPILLAISVFGCYILFGNDLTSQKAFVVLSTIVIIQRPLNFFGQILNDVLQGQVSLERVQKFMFTQEINTSYINYHKDSTNPNAIKIDNGNFKWVDSNNKKAKDQDKPRESAKDGSDLILKDINIEIKKGSFVAILGDVGSGKSSLFNCLMGEMLHDPSRPPSISINGSIAYVAQKPWIFNATIKDNILFNNEFNENDYQEALRTSSLKADLRTLIKQDETEIGEKGVNLSGGQKARVALARAIYANNDIYLLDDPLSAVDAHVGKYILEECLSKRLKDKTRVLVTHKIESLRYVDYIYIFKAGQVVAEGHFEEIKKTSYYQEIEEQANKETKNQEGGEDQSVGSRGSISEERGVSAHDPSDRNSKGVSAHQKRGQSSFHEGEDQKKLLGKLMLDEDRKTGAIGFGAWMSYFRYLGDKKFLFWQIVTLVVWIVLKVGADFWLANWSNASAEEAEDNNGFYYSVYAAFGIISATSLFIQTLTLLLSGIGMSRRIHTNMFKRVIRAPLNLFFDRVPLGRLVNRFASDLDMVDTTMTHNMTAISHFPLNLLSRFLVCSFVGTMWVFPLAFLFLILGVKIQRRYLAVYREAFRLSRITASPITGMFAESLDGLTQIRSSNSQGKFLTRYASRQNEHMKNQILVAGLQGWFQFYINVASLVIVGPTIAMSIIFSRGNVSSAGLVGLLVTYLLDLSNVMIATLQQIANFESMLIAFERCKAFANVEVEKEPTTKLPVSNYSYSWPENGQIEFKNYYAKYRPNLPYVVKDVSFTIQGSEKIGVVGRTGSGKSTLLLCLLRIIESNLGKIYIDGVDISEVGLDDLRRKITIIPQDPLLYKGTVRSNLDLFGQYSDHEMWNVLEKVCMKNKFQQLGLESEIKEGGENLSAGEKQLLCIARAILSKNKIVLIDEATSSIDNVTEETILQSIHDNFRDCTMITIAHRLKTIISSDKVLFMSGGQVAEFDSPQTLLKNKNGHFYKLWKEYEAAKA